MLASMVIRQDNTNMKTGRNDPCPCGSGKKFKHCCLAKQEPALSPDDLAWRRIRREQEGLPARMLRFATDVYGPGVIGEAWSAFMLWDEDEPDFDPESPHLQVFMPWLLHCWTPDPLDTEVTDAAVHEMSPTQVFLERGGHRIAPVLREYLQSCLAYPFSFHEVERCEPGHGIALRDVLTGERHDVRDRTASNSLQPHDVVFAQLASADGITLLESVAQVAFPPSDKVEIIDLRQRMRRAESGGDQDGPYVRRDQLLMWDTELRELYLTLSAPLLYPTMPELRTTDDEEIEFHKLVFDIDSAQLAFDALRHLDPDADDPEAMEAGLHRDANGILQQARIHWAKTRAGDDTGPRTLLGLVEIEGGRLVVDVKSRERADRFRAIVDEKLATHARFVADEVRTLEQLLDEAESPPISEPPRIAAAMDEPLIVDYLKAHYDQWVDDPLPALGNRTPREVVESTDGREQVEALLQGAEQQGLELSASLRKEVFDAVRVRLGLIA